MLHPYVMKIFSYLCAASFMTENSIRDIVVKENSMVTNTTYGSQKIINVSFVSIFDEDDFEG